MLISKIGKMNNYPLKRVFFVATKKPLYKVINA